MISFLIAAVFTVILSVICFILKLLSPEAFDAGVSSPPQRSSRFLSARLPRIHHHLSRERSLLWNLVEDNGSTLELCHRVLDTTLKGLGLNQFVSGIPLFVSYKIGYGNSMKDPHTQLGSYLCLVSIWSQLWIPLALRRPSKSSSGFRGALYLTWLVVFEVTEFAAIPSSPSLKFPIFIPLTAVACLIFFLFFCTDTGGVLRCPNHYFSGFGSIGTTRIGSYVALPAAAAE